MSTSGPMNEEARQLLALGKGLFEKGQYVDAERALSQMREEAERYADVQNMLGVIYHDQGQFSRAQRCFEQALKLNPAYTEAALNLSVIYNDAGRYDEARRIYESARARQLQNPTSLDPFVQGKIANLHAEIAEAYAASGQFSKAVEEYRRAVALGPRFFDLRLKLAAALADNGQRDASREELELLVKDAPTFPPARVALGVAFFTAGRRGDAEACWIEALRQRPGDRIAEMYLALLHPGQGARKA
jgi:tetratricopeptide (TPR) repeat protein